MSNQKELDDLHCIQIHLTNNNECIIQAISNTNINDIKLSKAKPMNLNNQSNKIKNEDLNLNNLNYLNNIESDDLMNLSITQNDLNSTSQKNIKNKNINNENDENSDNIIINFSELLESINSNDNLNLKTNSIIINKELSKNKLNNFPIYKNYSNANSENTKNNDNLPHDLVYNIKENNYLSYRNSNINSGKKTPLKYIKKQFNNKNENQKENQKEKEKINLNKKIINNEDIHGKNLLNNFNYIKGKNNSKNTYDYSMANKNIKTILNKELNILYDLNENKNFNNLNNVLINKVKIGNKCILNGKIKATQKNATYINDEKKITVNRVNSHKIKNNKNSKDRTNLIQNKKIKVTKNLEYNKKQIKINNSIGAKKGGKSKQINIIKNKSYVSIPIKKINFVENCSIKKKSSNDDAKNKNNLLNGDNLNLNNFLKILKKKITNNKNKSDSRNISENNKDSKSIEGSYFNNHNNNNYIKNGTDTSNKKKLNDEKKNIYIKYKNSKMKNRCGINNFIKGYPFIQYKYKTIDNNSHSNYNEFNSNIKSKSIYYNNNNITLTKTKNNSFNKSLTSRNTSNEKRQKNTSRKISLRTKEFNKFFDLKEIKEKYNEEKSFIPKTTKNNDEANTLKKSKSGKNAIKPKINIFNKILKKNKSQFGKTSKNKNINNIKNKIMNLNTETNKINKNKESRIKNNKIISKISIEKIIKRNINEFKTENYNKENLCILGYGYLTERTNTYNRKRNNLNEEESSIPSNKNFNGSGKNAKNNYMNTITYKSTSNINKFFNLIKPKEVIQNFSNYKKKKDNN